MSLANRKVLIKFVLESILTHFMQCAYIPISIYNKIDVIIRNILWGSSVEKDGIVFSELG